jgi:hypothetical protein
MEVSFYMDIAGLATSLSSAAVGQGVTLGVLNSVLKLESTVGAQLAASIGLGTVVDAYA